MLVSRLENYSLFKMMGWKQVFLLKGGGDDVTSKLQYY